MSRCPSLEQDRAAQKLNLSSKKKKHRPSTPSAAEAPLFATSFSGVLQTSPPPAPPCLLRAVNKVKDTPGVGKTLVPSPQQPVASALENPMDLEKRSLDLELLPKPQVLRAVVWWLYPTSLRGHLAVSSQCEFCKPPFAGTTVLSCHRWSSSSTAQKLPHENLTLNLRILSLSRSHYLSTGPGS
ncbi:hypothetical protein ACRRTK_005085 [Alexandromys fortis]